MTPRTEVFDGAGGDQVWIEGESKFEDSNILLTISNKNGERTALITGSKITPSEAALFVEAPPVQRHPGVGERFAKLRIASKYAGYIFALILISFSALSFSGVAKARVVLTGSMAPHMKPGDVIITTTPKYRIPEKGDIIAYTARRFNGAAVATISHRIVGGDGKIGFIVKGDQNKLPDVQRPTMADVKGVVIFVIPFIGNLLTPKALFLIVPCLFGFWLILDAMKNAE